MCWDEVIDDVRDWACYANATSDVTDCLCGPGVRLENRATYVIPPSAPATVSTLTKQQLQDETVFVFIHVNKAAGTTLKKILLNAAVDGGWSAFGLGTQFGYHFRRAQQLRVDEHRAAQQASASLDPSEPGPPSVRSFRELESEIMFLRCGYSYSGVTDVAKHFLEGGAPSTRDCPTRLVWGNTGMGLCDHFAGKPCVYLVTLRDPLSRALSDWHYFCVEGAERRKKWDAAWTARGCPLSPLQWFREMRTSPYFYASRLTLNCDAGCGAHAAIRNLRHPCVRYLLTDRFDDGLRKLASSFGGSVARAVDKYLANPDPRNVHSLSHEDFPASDMDELRELLAEDFAIYGAAVAFYEESWRREVVSC